MQGITIYSADLCSPNLLSPHDALKHHFTSLKQTYFPTTKGFGTKILMKLVYKYMAIFLIFKPHQIIFIHYKSGIAAAIRGL